MSAPERVLFEDSVYPCADVAVIVRATHGYAHQVSVLFEVAPATFEIPFLDMGRLRALGLALVNAANAVDTDQRRKP